MTATTIDSRRLAPFVWLLLSLPAAAAEVTLPLARYEELQRLARPAAEAPRETAAPIVFEACELAIEVGAGSARLVETWTVTLFGDGWRSLALPADRAVVESSFGAFEGALEGGAARTILLRGSGRSTVRLVSVAPLAVDQDSTSLVARLALELPPAASVSGELTAPPTVERVEPGGEVAVWRAGERWRFAGRPGAEIELTLIGPSPRPARDEEPLRFDSRVATAVRAARTRFAATSWLRVAVRAGRLDELRATLPDGLAVVDVRGAIAGWRVHGSELAVTPLARVVDALEVEVELAGPPRTTWSAPRLAVVGSERERELVRAAAENDGHLRVIDFAGARPAESQDGVGLPAAFLAAKGQLLALDPGALRPSWELAWAEGAELLSAQVDRLLYEVALGTNGRAFVRAWLEVRSSGLDRLAVEMPAGFELAQAERDGEPFLPGAEAGALVAPIVSGPRAQVVAFRGFVPLVATESTERLELALPAASVPIGRVEVRLIAPGSCAFEAEDRARLGAAAAPPAVVLASSTAGLAAPLWAPAERRAARSVFELPCAPGFVVSNAAWSALAPRPAALVFVREVDQEDASWF